MYLHDSSLYTNTKNQTDSLLFNPVDEVLFLNGYKSHCNERPHILTQIIFIGNNMLYIGMYGPKGPCEEVQVKHMGRNQYQVNYYVRERGDYILVVKWGEDNIPGSPYRVEV